jgi:hypothetical protein
MNIPKAIISEELYNLMLKYAHNYNHPCACCGAVNQENLDILMNKISPLLHSVCTGEKDWLYQDGIQLCGLIFKIGNFGESYVVKAPLYAEVSV